MVLGKNYSYINQYSTRFESMFVYTEKRSPSVSSTHVVIRLKKMATTT